MNTYVVRTNIKHVWSQVYATARNGRRVPSGLPAGQKQGEDVYKICWDVLVFLELCFAIVTNSPVNANEDRRIVGLLRHWQTRINHLFTTRKSIIYCHISLENAIRLVSIYTQKYYETTLRFPGIRIAVYVYICLRVTTSVYTVKDMLNWKKNHKNDVLQSLKIEITLDVIDPFIDTRKIVIYEHFKTTGENNDEL